VSQSRKRLVFRNKRSDYTTGDKSVNNPELLLFYHETHVKMYLLVIILSKNRP
jgi:hypothetical protein